eukprot:NODE_5264_length_1790_cov_9.919423.p1 GENE.NODE_5264_length_1790_cov_9.919423~~NODE_5264_length_1790_cov_9.919423.p1  ORF type:complete len:525 (+),score=185.30 NODE_5264_length_1790_cov_9.919423:181-1575(+)
MRDPQELDSEGLGHAAAAAAREGISSAQWWRVFTLRARELAPELAIHDIAMVLNGMARSRQHDAQLIKLLLPRIASRIIYLTSAHLAMVSSAIAKAEVHDPAFVQALTRELRARVMELHSTMETTMLVNAASKLRITDADLYKRFVAHVQSRAGYDSFHVRDISVLASALARVNCVDVATFGRFADCAVGTLPEATPLELARLMHAFMAATCTVDSFFWECVRHSRTHARTMNPTSLTTSAFAFGQCYEVAEVEHLRYLRRIFRYIRLASVASLPLFLPKDITGLLLTCSRWQVTFAREHLRRVAERVAATHEQFTVPSGLSAAYSMAVLSQRNVVRSVSSASDAEANALAATAEAARLLLGPVWLSLLSGEEATAMTLVRAVEASVVLRPDDIMPRRVVSSCLLQRNPALDSSSCASLREHLIELKVAAEEDVMLVLADRMRRRLDGGPAVAADTVAEADVAS